MYYLINKNTITTILDYMLIDDDLVIIPNKNTDINFLYYANSINGEVRRKADVVKDIIICDVNLIDCVALYNVYIFEKLGNKYICRLDYFKMGYENKNIKHLVRQLKINRLLGNE